MFFFRQTKKIVNVQGNLKLYYALVQSILTYGLIGWGGAYTCNIKPLQILQKRILKIIFNLPLRFPTEQLFKHCRILNLRQLFYASATVYLAKNRMFNEVISHNHETRKKARQNIREPMANRTIGQRSYYYIGHKIYNVIPSELRDAIYSASFKNKLKCWLRENDPIVIT